MSSPTPSQSPSPCGCGGAHASTTSSSGCGCGCGGQCSGAPADCPDGGAIVRPLFFAGQLLTEEDLQALSAYVAAKSRLHNRDFFGEGVACGFEVVCHPCGGGKVIVRPGHALDCCGNDIVLSTAQTLDVNALVRELRKTLQGGIDCGDPCADPAHADGRQRYSLFVRYCETLTDPVSAFVTDEPCGTAACEPTRVREGLRFELRCRGKADPSRDALCRIATCLVGDPGKLNALLADLTALDHVIQESEEGLALEAQSLPFKIEDLRGSLKDLETAAKPNPPIGRDFRNLVTRLDVVRVHLDRFNKLDPPPQDIQAEIKQTVPPVLDPAAKKIVDNLDTGAPTVLEKSFAHRVVELAEEAINRAIGIVRDPLPIDFAQKLDELLCSLFSELHARLDGTPEVTVCELSREVRNLASLCPAPTTSRVFSTAIDLARKLRDATWHSLQECICPAVLPPCPECHDPGVQLASLEVQSCEVVRICNLDRTLVATPVALRHWLPLRELQQIAAALCCRDLGHLDLKQLFDFLCPSTKDLATLASAFSQLRELIIEHEPTGLPFLLGEQAAKNADFEKRLEALEGRKAP